MSDSSYGQILKSTSLIGGAQGINQILGIVRVKFAAVLIGPLGVGLLGNYGAITGLVSTIAGLGIQSSGVRDVAVAVQKGDSLTISRTILTLRRICWITGLVGALVLVILSSILSQFTFGSEQHALDIGLLGVAILFGNISAGQLALIQGFRRIGELARISVVGAAASTLVSIGCYAGLGVKGIVPALLLIAGVQLVTSWYFVRRIPMVSVSMTWLESIRMSGGMVRLGFVFMWNGLTVSLVAYLTRVIITQHLNLEAVGIFTAAFALSGMFVNFVLIAMGSDYYPRLIAVASDRRAVNRLVNEQTEIGLLLAVPGLLITLGLAPWIIRVFYSDAFIPAAGLLQWFVLGCLGRIISWPLSNVMTALGKGAWFFATETFGNALHLFLIVVGLMVFGLEGVAMAFFIVYLAYTAGVYEVARRLTGFRWSKENLRLFLILLPIVAVTFLAVRLLPLWLGTTFGLVTSAIVTVMSFRSVIQKVGANHQIVRLACRVPGGRWVCGL